MPGEEATMQVTVRRETTQDVGAVRVINKRAFERTEEADIVDALRGVAHPQVSLVAESDGRVVGHIFLSPVTIESGDSIFDAMGLGPVAVLPELQRKGVGSELVRRGLEECGRLGRQVVVLVGHPHYYPRFGFAPARARGLEIAFEGVPDEAFMVVELAPGALRGVSGTVRFRPEFGGS
jgi:putative acetyltransferase